MAKKAVIFSTLILFVMATALCCCTPVFASRPSLSSCCHKNASVNKADQCILSSHHNKGTDTCQCQKITQGVPIQDFKMVDSIQSAKRIPFALTPAFVTNKIQAKNTLLLLTLRGSPPENLTAALYLRNSVLRI